MTAIHLRPARAADFEFFFHQHEQTFGPYVRQVWGWDDDDQRAHLHRALDIDATQVIVVDSVDLGRLTLGTLDDDTYIGLIEIAADHQRRGIGARIVHGIRDAAGVEGKGVRLHVLAVNHGAQKLYRRLGFSEVGREGTTPAIRIQMRAHPPEAAEIHLGHPWGLRPGTVDDRELIVEMARHACVIEDWPLPDADSNDVRELLPSSSDTVVIASTVLGRPVGAAWTFLGDPPLVVAANGVAVPELCIAVAAEMRGRGAGGALLDELAQRCAPEHDALCLNVHQRNTAARKLYVRCGFGEVGQGRGRLGLAMRKDLHRG